MLAKAHATARVDVPTSPHEFVVFCDILNSFMLVLPIHETQKSQSGEGGPSRDRLVFPEKTTSLSGILNPVQPGTVCVFFGHVLVDFCPIEHAHAAHQNLAQGRNMPCSFDGRGQVRLPPVVIPSVASTLFRFAGG